MNEVYSPVVSGSGVVVVHKTLEQHLTPYRVREFSPWLGALPLLARWQSPAPAAVTHSLPDLGPWVAHPDSRLVATFHNYYLDAEQLATSSPAQRIFYRTMMRHATIRSVARADVVTAVSHFTADLVRRELKPGKRLLVIRNGVDHERFQPPAARNWEGVRILFSGNPIRRKGFGHVVALAGSLPPEARILYTEGLRGGEESLGPGLEALPRRSHAEMPALYQDSDILFFPTLREGLSLSVLEAMACGLPVVATRCSSLPEQIEHGRGGFLFEPGNRQQMRDYLERLIRNPGLRAEMGAYNRERILRDFRLEQMLQAYQELFATLGARLDRKSAG